MIGPLLHAAALSGRTVIDVYNWILEREESEPEAILIANNAYDANRRLENVYSYTERQRDGIIGMAASYLQMYAHPSAQTRLPRQRSHHPARRCSHPGQANTLYIVAGREYQKLLAPLVVTLLSSMLHYLSEQENQGLPQKPPALFALDEMANIAPLQNLAAILSTSLPSARFITVWHSVAQMHATYKDDVANALLGLSLAKVFLGSITDQYTIRELAGLLGEQSTNRADMSPHSITAQAMQRTRSGQGLLIHTDFAPVFYKQRRYYDDPHLQQLANAAKPKADRAGVGTTAERARPASLWESFRPCLTTSPKPSTPSRPGRGHACRCPFCRRSGEPRDAAGDPRLATSHRRSRHQRALGDRADAHGAAVDRRETPARSPHLRAAAHRIRGSRTPPPAHRRGAADQRRRHTTAPSHSFRIYRRKEARCLKDSPPPDNSA